ncbi:MAG: MerR family transcriptional regulator [Lachnospiraceae bacterium]|nr:MerR family transcriptional regulator [Lachnospiraceae bacterium]
MRTVHEVSKLTGVSIRTLQYYDKIGLLHPAEYTESGYRLYDDAALEKLQQILLFRELEFPLKDIKAILESPDFDREKALEQQITLLLLKKEHLEALIDLARGIKTIGVNGMDFTAFDTKKMDEYAAQAKASWGNTPEYREFEEKAKKRKPEEERRLHVQMMTIFAEFGKLREGAPDSSEAQLLVKRLQDFITEHYYACSDEILSSLGSMYAGGGKFMKNIDAAGGEGTAAFVNKAVQVFCSKEK